MDLIIKFTCDEAGSAAVEYALLLTLISLGVAAGVATFGTALTQLFDNAAARFAAAV
jgi:Flp pilus assembly pilin Flp